MPLHTGDQTVAELTAGDQGDDGVQRGGFIVVLQAEQQRFGLVVDDVLDTQEIVVKPLGRHLKNLPLYAGATILGRVTIGRGATIGGNIWLTRSVPAGSHVSQASAQHEPGGAGRVVQ